MAKIAVIGGGPMGLVAAYNLSKLGHKVLLYEAGPVIGGMSASFDFSGMVIERYYHFICQSDESMFSLLKELELIDQLRWVKAPMGFYYNGQLFSWGSALSLLMFTPLSLLGRIRYGVHAFFSIYRNDWSQLDKLDAVTWIKKWIGITAYNVTWKKLFELKFYKFTSNLSAAWIWSRIHRMGNSSRLGYLDGGSEVLLQVLDKRIKLLGGKIILNTPVKSVVTKSSVEGLGFKKHKHIVRTILGSDEEYDAVISTVPLSYVPQMMPDLPQELLDQYRAIDNIAVVCVLVKLNRQVTDKFWLNISDDRMDIPGIIEYTNLRPMGKHLVYVPYYMPVKHPMFTEGDDVFERKVRRYLNMINPDISEEAIEAIEVSRYKQAQPICPPQFLEILPPARTNIFGLYIADTSYYYPEDRSISESVKLGAELAKMVKGDFS